MKGSAYSFFYIGTIFSQDMSNQSIPPQWITGVKYLGSICLEIDNKALLIGFNLIGGFNWKTYVKWLIPSSRPQHTHSTITEWEWDLHKIGSSTGSNSKCGLLKKNHFASYFDLFNQTFIPIGTIFKALLAQLMDCHQVNDYAVLLYVYVIPDHN